MRWQSSVRIVAVALFAITLSGATTARASNDSAVPAIPCWKCVYNGVITAPSSGCQPVDTNLLIDFGHTTCTNHGWETGIQTCSESGNACMWTNLISMTGTGLPAASESVVGDAEMDLRNCRGEVLAWADNRSATAVLEHVTL